MKTNLKVLLLWTIFSESNSNKHYIQSSFYLFSPVGKEFLSKCDSFNFNYHLFDTGPYCSTVRWNYQGQMCTPVTYTLQGFSLSQVIASDSGHLGSPRIEFNSTSMSFTFPTHQFVNEILYFRVFGINSLDDICNTNSLAVFYNFTMLLENGMRQILRCQANNKLFNVLFRLPSHKQ